MGPRAAFGLAMLCALLFSASAAQSASAASAKNTTAFTCVENGGAKDFSDAHCDTNVGVEKGKFGHVAIKTGETTKVTLTNKGTKNVTTESTNAVFKASPFGVKTEITCTEVSGEGTFTNKEPEAGVHTGSGSGTTKATKCTVNKPEKCTLKEVTVTAEGVPIEGLGAGKNEMGSELKPSGGGKIFTEITLAGECAIAGKPFPVEGTAIATGGTATQIEKHSGATAVLTNAMTKETLTAGGKPAEISLVATVRQVTGNPLSGTTVT